MAKITTAVVIFVVLISIALSNQSKTGLKLKFTNKGLKYMWNMAMANLQEKMEGNPLKLKNGIAGRFTYEIRKSLVERFRVGSNHLSSLKGVGVKATVQGISLAVTIDFQFMYKIGFFKFRDNVSVRGKTEGANFEVDLGIQKREDGKPLMSLLQCHADVGDLQLHFSRSRMSIIYNLIAGLFRRKIRNLLNKKICDSMERKVNIESNSNLENIKVRKQLGKWAMIDYGLAEAPQFKEDFMDIPLKGYFTSVSGEFANRLSPPAFPPTEESDKMVYCWISDYFFNTAGEVYHNSGLLKAEIDHDKAQGFVKALLGTSSLKAMVPGLHKKYPNHNLGATIKSSTAPKLLMKPGDVRMLLYAELDFQVITKEGPVPVFGYNLEVVLKGKIWIADGYLQGKVTDMRIDPMMRFSNVGQIGFPISNLRLLFQVLVIDNLKGSTLQRLIPYPPILTSEKFEGGMALPVVGIAKLNDTKIEFHEGYMLISSDLKYAPELRDKQKRHSC